MLFFTISCCSLLFQLFFTIFSCFVFIFYGKSVKFPQKQLELIFFCMYSLIQVGSFVQPYVNSLSSIMSWLPILSQPLADGAEVYPGEGWCKVHIIQFTSRLFINIKYSDALQCTEMSSSYSETLNNEYIERIHQMSYSSLSDNGMLQIFSFLIK